MSDLKIGDRVTGIKGNTRVTGTVMNIKEGHVHIKAPVSGVYAPLVSIVPLHKVTKLGEGAMKRKAEDEDDAGMSDYMHHVQTSAPFDNAKPAKPHQDQFGNKIKIGNVAKNLAKQGMRGVKKEEVEQIDEAGVMKKVGRAIAGWGAFDKDKPKDVVKNTKSMSNDALSKIAAAKRGSFSFKKSPAALQQKVAKRELEKRSVSEEAEQIAEVGPQKRLKRVFNKLRDARAGAAYKQSGMPVPEREPGHKNTVDHNKALGRALRKMSEDLHSRKVYEPTSAQALNPGLRAKIDAASNAQKPAPEGRRPIGKIKLMTREEAEQIDELSKDTLGKYVKSAEADATNKNREALKNRLVGKRSPRHADAQATADALDRARNKRLDKIDLARAKMTKEEVEQVEEGYKARRAFGSAYDKTHDPFQDSKSRFKSRELEHELAHETPSPRHHDQTPHDVHIDGKKWKTFGSAGHAHNVANKLSISGKRATVHKTPIAEKAPPGWEGTVKAMKKHPEIDNPFALAWWMKRKGAKSHKGKK